MLKRVFADVVPHPSVPPEIEVTDVTRVECVLDTGLALSFDLGTGDTFTEDESGLHVKLGPRTINIREHRILYSENRPEKLKRIVAPK